MDAAGSAASPDRDRWNSEGHRNVRVGRSDIQLRFESDSTRRHERRLHEIRVRGRSADRTLSHHIYSNLHAVFTRVVQNASFQMPMELVEVLGRSRTHVYFDHGFGRYRIHGNA